MHKIKEWEARIDASADGSTVIDLSKELIDLISRNIITITFGQDLNDVLLPFYMPKDKNYKEWELKEAPLGKCFDCLTEQIVNTMTERFMHPKIFFFYNYT